MAGHSLLLSFLGCLSLIHVVATQLRTEKMFQVKAGLPVGGFHVVGTLNNASPAQCAAACLQLGSGCQGFVYHTAECNSSGIERCDLLAFIDPFAVTMVKPNSICHRFYLVDPCWNGVNPCLNGGTCIGQVNWPVVCQCPQNYTGAFCEHKQPLAAVTTESVLDYYCGHLAYDCADNNPCVPGSTGNYPYRQNPVSNYVSCDYNGNCAIMSCFEIFNYFDPSSQSCVMNAVC